MNWIQKNFKTLIYTSFLIPIILVAAVSISHVTKWYGISNPFVWAIYLSVGIEIAALSALAAISAKMGKKVYFPFGIVTLVQFIGNIFFAYQYIDINSQVFKDWVDLVNPLVSLLGVDETDLVGHKRFLAFFSGGMLPLISLSFLHMLVKFEESDKVKKEEVEVKETKEIDYDKLSKLVGKEEIPEESLKYTPSESELEFLEKLLNRIDEEKFGHEEVENELDTKEIEEVTDESEVSVEVPEEVIEETTQEEITPEEIKNPEIKRLNYTKRENRS
jgi:hypothetical protein